MILVIGVQTVFYIITVSLSQNILNVFVCHYCTLPDADCKCRLLPGDGVLPGGPLADRLHPHQERGEQGQLPHRHQALLHHG